MRLQLLLILFLTLNSCAIFEQRSLGSDFSGEVSKICLSAEGKGRLLIDGHKFVFKFYSALEEQDAKWYMSLLFPISGEETFVVDWDDKGLLSVDASFESKILSEKKGVDPEKLHLFLKKWGELIVEISKIRKNANYPSVFSWSTTKKELIAKSKISKKNVLRLEFKNLTLGNYFGRHDVFMHSEYSEDIKLELIVRKCLEKSDS